MARPRGEPPPDQRKPWFNWPLAAGLIVNFAIIALVAGCIVHALGGPGHAPAQ
jgi:hypothetical protein